MAKKDNIYSVKLKSPETIKYAKDLKKSGYDIYVYDNKGNLNDKQDWFYAVKDGDIAYIQNDKFRGFSFSTLHKGNRQTGTGFRVKQEIYNPKVEDVKSAFIKYPNWATEEDIKSVEKYKDFSEYQKSRDSLSKYKRL